MSRITGCEERHQIPPKVMLMYTAVLQLMEEGADVTNIRVSSITERAGIGKGTAYEYFDSKEEIVACAIIYHIGQIFGWLEQQLFQQSTFREQLDFLLEEMAKKDGRKYCFWRFVHLLTDRTELSRIIQEKMQSEEFAPFRPMAVFEKVLRSGVDRGELKGNMPMEYMVYSLFSHLLTYMMTITGEENLRIAPEEMRECVRQGILRELLEEHP